MKPKDYLDGDYLQKRHWTLQDRSKVIGEYFQKYAEKEDTILELGSSAGRNLVHLRTLGFENLTGLEMSDKAVVGFQFPLIHARYEEAEIGEYDIIFSASFLQDLDGLPANFTETLKKTKKYFLVFGDYINETFYYQQLKESGFEEVEKVNHQVFSQPIRIWKKL